MRRGSIAAIACLVGIGLAETSGQGTEWLALLDRGHPGRFAGRSLYVEGTKLLREGKLEEARAALREAVVQDPLLVPGWVNLSAAAIRACDATESLFAALVARLLDPASEGAAANLRIALAMECPEPEPAPDPLRRLERDAFARQQSAELWTELAAAERTAGHRLLAVLFEAFAVQRGADPVHAARRISSDLEREGLLAAALEALAAVPGDEAIRDRKELLRSRVARIEPIADAIARDAAAAGLLDDAARRAAAEVAAVHLARGEDREVVRRKIRDAFGVGRPRTLAGPWGEIDVGPGWVVTGGGDGGPILEATRFPGDTRLWIFPWTDPDPGALASGPLGIFGAALRGRFAPCPTGSGGGFCRQGRIAVDLGAEAAALLAVRIAGPGPDRPSVAALGLAGDAGCGAPCRRDREEELARVLASLRPGAELPPPQGEWSLELPPGWQPPGAVADESSAPWRGYLIGGDLRIDLPPGLTVAPIRRDFRDALAGPGTVLWFRGRFVDLDGKEVVIGDAGHAGLVELPGGGAASLEAARREPSELAPRADPSARLLGATGLDAVLERAGTGQGGVIARFGGGAFPGQWLAMRVLAGGRAVDVVLPVSRGADSLSLLWIPLTVRPADRPGPPPPVDLGRRFRVAFRRFERSEDSADPRGGILSARDVELAVPKGFGISLSGGSGDGFPIRLRARSWRGAEGKLERWAPGVDLEARRRQVEAEEGGPPASGWTEPRRTKGGRITTAVYEAAGRCHVILVGDGGGRAAYHVELRRGEMDPARWREACRLVAASIRYRRAAR
ncbi:MAG: hypothetical protein D6718_05750 [Acidobacteria bacterium]|nr:MAG: hypothetical protein D6718_05750 [Acidobacteriota bacterium]